MNKMKRKTKKSILTLFAMLFVFLMSLTTQAQDHKKQQGPPPPPPPIPDEEHFDKMMSDLTQTLSLTEEQAAKISELFEKHFKILKEKMEENKKHQEEMEALKDDFEKEIKAVLNKDQKKQFEDFVKEKDKGRRPNEKHKKREKK